ncbi:carboxylesterase family protein [Myxococcaceae bacterium GXIMD 01537]
MASTQVALVTTQEGQLQGLMEEGVYTFKGIPYAKPPVKNLRWRPPERVEPWTGVRQAVSFGKSSHQSREKCIEAGGGDPGPLSEDCLYLNVWTPQLPAAGGKQAGGKQAGLPVLFWIHGGAHVIGAGGLPPYHGVPLAKRGAVVVTINYRLGHLGFFSHPALERESDGGAANFGMLDQIAALQWVQRNIAQFGGDPRNVTIFGQSAGGKSVLSLFCSPLAQNLFHKGIAMSVYELDEVPRQEASMRGVEFATAAGLSGANATAAELRGLSPEKFWQMPPTTSTAPVAISGDTVLPNSIIETFRAGTEARLPLILGSTSDDSSVVVDFGVDPVKIIEMLREKNIPIKTLYPGVPDDHELGRQVCRDIVFTLVPRQIAELHSKRAPTWRYYFEYVAEAMVPERPDGVPHGGEVPFFFETADDCPPTSGMLTEKDKEFSRVVTGYVVEFARTGSPGSEWVSHQTTQDRTMRLGATPKLETNFMKPRLDAYLLAGLIIGGTQSSSRTSTRSKHRAGEERP